MTGTTVIIGPRTRAGRALRERVAGRDDAVFVVARHDADAAALAADDVTVLRLHQDIDLMGDGSGPVRIVVCALGPVHPDEARAATDSAAFLRDLAFIERLLVALAGRPISVVLISTVIALAPGEHRRYYGGWKCLVEQQLGESIDRLAPGAGFSVLYPGRLVDGPARRVLPALHPSYGRLAATIDDLAYGRPRSHIAGIDARLWTAFHGLKLLFSSLLPHRPCSASRPVELSVGVRERFSWP